jgi:Cdc6-like AAA superfamily ATPase
MRTDDEWKQLDLDVTRAFRPAAPIDKETLFAGRTEQIRRVVDAINQPGQHAIVFGERGVGKTSLVNVLATRILVRGAALIAPHVNCDSGDDHSSLWRKVFSEIELIGKPKQLGFSWSGSTETTSPIDTIPEKLSSDDVRKALSQISQVAFTIVIIDEFDRISEETVRRMFADTIKALSDHATHATIIVVGVSDSVDGLIKEHQSIERALVQVHMPRMDKGELDEIITKGLELLKMQIDDDAMSRISTLSQGLPHYTHLLALHATRQAIDSKSERIQMVHVEGAIKKALSGAQQSIQSAYHIATMSPRRETIYSQVLLACALASHDELGYFAAASVRDPLRRITSKKYEIPSFARHLNEFCDDKRGGILHRIGVKRRYRFRFANPLMQPFVIMKGLADGLLTQELLRRIEQDHEKQSHKI